MASHGEKKADLLPAKVNFSYEEINTSIGARDLTRLPFLTSHHIIDEKKEKKYHFVPTAVIRKEDGCGGLLIKGVAFNHPNDQKGWRAEIHTNLDHNDKKCEYALTEECDIHNVLKRHSPITASVN